MVYDTKASMFRDSQSREKNIDLLMAFSKGHECNSTQSWDAMDRGDRGLPSRAMPEFQFRESLALHARD